MKKYFKILVIMLCMLVLSITLAACRKEDKNISSVEKIEIKAEATYKKDYKINQNLDIDGLIIEAKYSDDSVKDIDVTLSMISGFETYNIGKNKIATIIYEGKTTTFKYNVADEPTTIIDLVSIELKSGYIKDYKVNDVLDISGLVLVAKYSDDSVKDVDVTLSMVSGFETINIGKDKIATIIYDTKAIEFTYNVEKELSVMEELILIMQNTSNAKNYNIEHHEIHDFNDGDNVIPKEYIYNLDYIETEENEIYIKASNNEEALVEYYYQGMYYKKESDTEKYVFTVSDMQDFYDRANTESNLRFFAEEFIDIVNSNAYDVVKEDNKFFMEINSMNISFTVENGLLVGYTSNDNIWEVISYNMVVVDEINAEEYVFSN